MDKKEGSEINRQMRLFVLRLAIVIVVWKVLYIFFLQPIRIPDAFLTHVLSSSVVFTLKSILRIVPDAKWVLDSHFPADNILSNGRTILDIYDACNGLDLYLIYLTFVLLLPYTRKRKITFSFIGIAAIFIGNIIRCIWLYWIYVYHRDMFDINHHYIFSIMMYLIILGCWLLFIKKGRLHETS